MARSTIKKREEYLPVFEPGTLEKLKKFNSFTRESTMIRGDESNPSDSRYERRGMNVPRNDDKGNKGSTRELRVKLNKGDLWELGKHDTPIIQSLTPL